jgi:hypothetical protein
MAMDEGRGDGKNSFTAKRERRRPCHGARLATAKLECVEYTCNIFRRTPVSHDYKSVSCHWTSESADKDESASPHITMMVIYREKNVLVRVFRCAGMRDNEATELVEN